MGEIFRLGLLLLTFAVSYYCILGLDFEKILRKGKIFQAQILAILIAMALSVLVVEFLLALDVFML